MPPEERRAVIIAAARPLFATEGVAVTTKQVADAAGIAEGTLFRVFPTKRELIGAVIEDVLDSSDLMAALADLHPTSVEDAVRCLLHELMNSIRETSEFFVALHASASEDTPPPPKGADAPEHKAHVERAREMQRAVAGVLEPFADQLATTPDRAATFLRGVAFANAHHFVADGNLSSADDLAPLVLHGLSQES